MDNIREFDDEFVDELRKMVPTRFYDQIMAMHERARYVYAKLVKQREFDANRMARHNKVKVREYVLCAFCSKKMLSTSLLAHIHDFHP